ncbi:PREDICTED: protein virilizer homolog [Priapulus caudatus]|uniref:Protein virilizer homolog n=1 Tax=Priapulus caudatus TaxID=37621 RepID=A0ABM1EII0_PRICU|nr:PREDICTED: protein virilizer homolog [Priapulus caudatus]
MKKGPGDRQAGRMFGPQRGRGRGQRNDHFRQRPPNTSRPPSMHVDDFVIIEKSQSGVNRPGAMKMDSSALRGRGRSSYGDERRGGRGRFFTPPGNYSRREGSRGGGGGGLFEDMFFFKDNL